MRATLFNRQEFARQFRAEMLYRRVSFRELERLLAVDHCALHRVVKGKSDPSLEVYLRIKQWFADLAAGDAVALSREYAAALSHEIALKSNARQLQ